MKKLLSLGVLVAVSIALTLGTAYATDAAKMPAPKIPAEVGDPMVDLTLPGTNGDIKLSDGLGSKATVVIWAQSACSACRNELSRLKNLKSATPGVNYVVIMVDVGGKDMSSKLIEKYDVASAAQVMYDKDFVSGTKYNVYSTPTVMVIKDTKVTEKIYNLSPREDKLMQVLKAL